MKIKTILKTLTCIALTLSMYFVTPQKVNAITFEQITAPTAVLIDENSGTVIFDKNSHDKRACASITKVMTLTLVFEALDSGKIKIDDKVTTSARAESMGGSDIWLEEGEKMSVDDMIKATVVASANDAAVALAEYVSGSEEEFVKQMNKKADKLNMKETTFKNCNGLDEEGHITSAYDVALMSRELLTHKEIFNYSTIWMDYLRGGETQIVNTNKLLNTYDGITGLKTGTTNDAGSCISATAKRDGLSLIAVVLGSKTGKERFNDAKTLLDYGFSNYTTIKTTLKEALKPIKVKNAMSKEVLVGADLGNNMLVDKSKKNLVKSKVKYNKNITAPIKKGEKVGEVIYYVEEKKIARCDIKVLHDVKEIEFLSVLSLLYQYLVLL